MNLSITSRDHRGSFGRQTVAGVPFTATTYLPVTLDEYHPQLAFRTFERTGKFHLPTALIPPTR